MKQQNNPDFIASLIDAEALYEHAPCGYFSFLPDGSIIKINQTLLSWLGYSLDEVVGAMKTTDLFPVGGKIYYEMFYFPLIRLNGLVKEISFDILRKNGSKVPALLNSSAIKSPEGNLLAVNVVVIDITDRKKYESQLLNAKQFAEAEKGKFEFVSDYIPEMIWTAAADGRINYFNKRFAENFGYSGEARKAANFLSILHPEDKRSAIREWITAVRQGEAFEIRARLGNTLGLFNWYILKGIPYLEPDGTLSRWLGSCLNISDHMLELDQKDDFISIVSHELKTPVTSLKVSLQLLERLDNEQMPKIYTKLVNQSSKSVIKILTLIDELLNVNRLNKGQMMLNLTTFSVVQLLDSCCQHIRLEGKYRLQVQGDSNLCIHADEHRIDQVLINFVNNAIKYAPASELIILEVVKVGGMVKISVRDFGPGIEAEKLPHLFERYFRVDHSGVQYSGLGLGLYICAEIIKRHNGKIGVDSEPGKGSSFWFMLPLES